MEKYDREKMIINYREIPELNPEESLKWWNTNIPPREIDNHWQVPTPPNNGGNPHKRWRIID